MEQGQPLCDALECAKVATVDALHIMLKEVAKVHGAEDKPGADRRFTEEMRMDVIRGLADNYGHLSVDEIALVMSRARTPDGSKEQKVFGQLTPAVMLSWVGAYAKSDERVKYWESQNNAATDFIEERGEDGRLLRYRAGGQNHNAPTDLVEMFAPMLRRLTSGKIAPNGKAPEYKPASLTVPPKPGTAQWYRAEADRVEARDEAEEARKQLVKAKISGMIELEPMEKDFKANYGRAGFERFAKENYYDLLSENEARIIEEAGMGPLKPEDVEIHDTLQLAWQGVIMAWEDKQVEHIVKLGESLNEKNHD